MSLTATSEVRCSCGATLSVFCADSINAERHPHMREAILARTLHVFRCDACLGQLVVDKAVVYIDLARKQMYSMHPAPERIHERAHGEALVDVWARTVGSEAGEAAQASFDGERFHVRVCYGLEELREKLVVRDAGLSDLVLEALKVELLAASSELRDASVIALRLDRADERELAFLAERASSATLHDQEVVVERARYDALARVAWQELLARFPGIASGPHVSMLRWTLPA